MAAVRAVAAQLYARMGAGGSSAGQRERRGQIYAGRSIWRPEDACAVCARKRTEAAGVARADKGALAVRESGVSANEADTRHEISIGSGRQSRRSPLRMSANAAAAVESRTA